jgi:hypothetical protein
MNMKWMRWLRRRLLYGGSSIRPYERRIIEAAAATLANEDAETVLRQMRAVEAVQRSLKGRHGILMLADDKADLPRLGAAECTVRFELRTPGGQTTAAVTCWDGLLSTVEFAKPPRQFLAGGFEVVSATAGGKWRGPAEAADRLEHGRHGPDKTMDPRIL